MKRTIHLVVEVDVKPERLEELEAGYTWAGEGVFAGVEVEVSGRDEHGFGLTELVDIAITVGEGVTVKLLSDAIKEAVVGVVRRARVKRQGPDDEKPPFQDLDHALEEEVEQGTEPPHKN